MSATKPADREAALKEIAASLGDLADSAKASAVLVSAGMLLVVRTAYDSFAEALGVTARDLGYGPAELIAQAGFSLILLSGLVVLIGLAATVASVQPSPSIRRLLAVVLIALWFAPTAVALGQPDFVSWVTGPALLVGMGALTFGIVGIVVSPPDRRTAVALLVGIVVVACTAVLAREWGRFEAQRVLRGELSGVVGPFGMVRFVAEPICLTQSTTSASGNKHDVTTPGLLLGRTSQATAVLEGARVVLIPSADTTLATRSGKHCPAINE